MTTSSSSKRSKIVTSIPIFPQSSSLVSPAFSNLRSPAQKLSLMPPYTSPSWEQSPTCEKFSMDYILNNYNDHLTPLYVLADAFKTSNSHVAPASDISCDDDPLVLPLKNNLQLEDCQKVPCDNMDLDLKQGVLYSTPSLVHQIGHNWKAWIRHIHMFGKFAGIPELSSQWLPTVMSYKYGSGLVPSYVQNDFIKSIIQSHGLSVQEILNAYNSVTNLGFHSALEFTQKRNLSNIVKLKEIFRAHLDDGNDLNEMLKRNFPFRNRLRFVTPFRELCMVYLMTLLGFVTKYSTANVFEFVELHHSVPGYLDKYDCSNTMAGIQVTMAHQGLLKEFVQVMKGGMKHGLSLMPFYDKFADLAQSLVWGSEEKIIRRMCCDSVKCSGSIMENGEKLVPGTLFHSMVVDDPDPLGEKFYLWVRIGVDSNFVFRAPPLFGDRAVFL